MAKKQIIKWSRPRRARRFRIQAKSQLDGLKAYQDSVVDAATVSATLWFSYLFVLFYLLVAVAGVTHTDLFLENPVKLPFLNVDLPLVGFFWFGPALFLIVHTYVLLHFSFLTRKARTLAFELSRLSDRGVADQQRELLPNNIFVQLLAGPHDSRAGLVGLTLRIVAIVSLAVGPVLLLVFFVLQFLPYHSSSVTWWQRLAVVLDLLLVWRLWPFIVGRLPATVAWRSRLFRYLLRGELLTFLTVIFVFTIATFPGEFLDRIPFSVRFIPTMSPSVQPSPIPGGTALPVLGSRQMLILKRTANGPVVVSRTPILEELSDQEKSENEAAANKASFLNSTKQWLGSIGWISLHTLLVDGEVDLRTQKPKSIFANRIVIPGFDLRADPKFDSMTKIASLPRTVSLRSRDLRGAVLIDATLPRADFTAADLRGAYFDGADLRAATFSCAPSRLERTGQGLIEVAEVDSDCTRLGGARFIASSLQGANFQGAQAKGAGFDEANLRGAQLSAANLQGANFFGAHLEGAVLFEADLRGAILSVGHWEGASLERANAEGAQFNGSHLEGASLAGARLQVADFGRAYLQASLLSGVDLEGANLDDADLEGAILGPSDMATLDDDMPTRLQGASFRHTWVWRTDASNVDGASEIRAINVQGSQRPVCPNEQQNNQCFDGKSAEQLTQLIKENVPTGPDLPSWWDPQAKALERIRRLNTERSLVNEETMSNFWNSMKPFAPEKDSPYEILLAKLIIKFGCADDGAPYVAARVLNRFSERLFSKESSQPRLVAAAFLDRQHCPASAVLSEYQNDGFRRLLDGTWAYPDDLPN
jgi:uncharacterized protein YjbI with pentapeptide repeats